MADYLRESGVKWLWEKIKTLLSAKQDKLVSGTNIKTINGTSLLGSGDVSIEGGGNFDSSGTYPNLTAGKATKLATARKIGLTGGAVGTATNFDGSAAINIPVTALYEDKLGWGTTNVKDGTIVDNIMRQARMNILSFMPASAITAEYSNNGGATWIDYGMTDEEKVALVTPILLNYKYLWIGNTQTDFTNQNKTRIIIDLVSGNIQGQMRKLYLDFMMDNPSVFIDVFYETYNNYGTDTWSILVSDVERRYGDISVAIPNSLSYMGHKLSGTYSARLKIEIYRKDTGSGRVTLNHIEMLASEVNRANAFVGNGSPMTVDYQQNVTFSAAITAAKLITKNGTANQVVLGNGSLRPISELSPITDADAEILLDNHIHSINVNANGNYVNISVIESSKNGNNWETEDNDITIPLATTTSAGVMSAADKQKLDSLGGNIGGVGAPETLSCNTTYVVELGADDTLSITGFVAPTTLFGNYTVHLKTSTNNSISLPSTLLWANGEQPTFEDNTCYELSITATLFDAEYVYKAVLVAFK